MEGKSKLSAQWWWFDSQSNSTPRKSPWLHSTLAELDDKTEAMLKLIEEDADSFAKRAEMYYRKRPELISMVEDLYRAHRSLAERYDQVKFDSGGSRHLITPWTSCPLPLSKFRASHLMKESETSYDSYSESFDFDHDSDSVDSVIIDEIEIENETEAEAEKEISLCCSDEEEGILMKLREEIERLREENKVQKQELLQKDEEKREAIRQLCFSVDLLKQENVFLKTRIPKDSSKKQNSSCPFELTKLKGGFWGKLFSGEPTTAAVPL